MFFVAGLVRSTLLYGLISLLVCLFVLRIPVTPTGAGFTGGFFAFVSASIAIYPLLLVIHPVFVWVGHRRRRMRFSYFQSLFDALGADFTNPFRGLVALRGASRTIDSKGFYGAYAWGQVILHLVWAAAFWIYFATAYVLLITA